MNRPVTLLPVGTRVRTHDLLDAEDGLLVEALHLAARRAGASGTIAGIVPEHGGDVYLVQHAGEGPPGAYCYSEIELGPAADGEPGEVVLAA